MERQTSAVSRRAAIGVAGATAATTALLAGGAGAWAAPAGRGTGAHGTGTAGSGTSAADAGAPVRLLLNGAPATRGSFAFPDEVDTVVLDNGLVRFTFGLDARGSSISATSVVVDGVELGHNLNGSNPADDGKQPSFYVDAQGGGLRLRCTEIRVLRVADDLAEVAFVDSTSTPLRHEHHLIMRRGRRGLYGFDVLTAVDAVAVMEARMISRWDRSIFDHSFNWERGSGQQPTYRYLNTQVRLQDETWRVNGVNNPDLFAPESNSGNLPAGTAYTKYDWSLYHHENPMFGHYGHGFGVWFTPLGGVTENTLCAYYGVGPTHQDLAIHQDAIILNYFGANHYNLPPYQLPSGYRRLYGPWYTFLNTGAESDPDALIADAAQTAHREIAENVAGSDWMDHPLYPPVHRRSTVTGRLRLADGRSAGDFWVVLSTQSVQDTTESIQDAADVYVIHEPTYFVRTRPDGSFTLPGVPPAWRPGTSDPGAYTLHAFAADGSVTGQFTRSGIVPHGAEHDLGTLTWQVAGPATFLWQIGRSDRTSGEYALATRPVERDHPRGFDKPAQVPGDLTFTIGSSWEPTDWYYAQTRPGTWTVRFTLDQVPPGTAVLTVSSAMQAGKTPQLAVNGSTEGLTGSLPMSDPADVGGTIPRQADRSARRRISTVTFPTTRLRAGENTLTFTRGSASTAGDGMGWDTMLLEVAEPTPAPGSTTHPKVQLRADVVGLAGPRERAVWTVRVTNTGPDAAGDVRLAGVRRELRWGGSAPVPVIGRDPAVFPVPVVASLAPGAATVCQVTTDLSGDIGGGPQAIAIGVSAAGGRATTTATVRQATWPWAAGS